MWNKLALVFMMTSAGLCVLSAEVTAAEHTKDNLKTVKENLKNMKAVLIDVRELSEWEAGHLKQATLIPLSKIVESPQDKKLLKLLPKDKIIYLHCRSGGRCRTAADVLKSKQLDLRPLKPGYKDLKAAGFEVIQPK